MSRAVLLASFAAAVAIVLVLAGCSGTSSGAQTGLVTVGSRFTGL
jgi:hypothetical protein